MQLETHLIMTLFGMYTDRETCHPALEIQHVLACGARGSYPVWNLLQPGSPASGRAKLDVGDCHRGTQLNNVTTREETYHCQQSVILRQQGRPHVLLWTVHDNPHIVVHTLVAPRKGLSKLLCSTATAPFSDVILQTQAPWVPPQPQLWVPAS